jgi:lipopolysaccharide/colanic/teichoic acid biosynthesis glycosyltransferase
MKNHFQKIIRSLSGPIESGISESFSDVVIGRDTGIWSGVLGEIGFRFKHGVKRIYDIFFSLIFLLMASPLFLAAALAIKITSKGSVFFTQERVGYKGKTFKIYKFRTMKPDRSDQEHIQYVQSLLKDNADNPSGSELIGQYIDYIDRRTTAVGKWLRATSLDELPQLINIFRGEMSLVGPRPHPMYEVNAYKKWYCRRLEVKPGLTGWSKLNLRLTPQNYEEAILYDLWYVDHWSLLLDIRILVMTVPMVVMMKDAH